VKHAVEKEKPPFYKVKRRFEMVAWGGIEPPTQGFSKHVLVKNLYKTSTYNA
jgi:hypothetical protein